MIRVSRLLAFVVTALVFAGPVRAELIYGITGAFLIRFDSTMPNAVTTIGPISGLPSGEFLHAIDFRPSNGKLYGLAEFPTDTARHNLVELFTIDLGTGQLTPVGGVTNLGNDFDILRSIDFDPVSGALRVVGTNGTSDRIDADTGSLIASDPGVSNNNGLPFELLDIAYTNNVVGATSSTLFGYDDYNNLITIDPISGTFTTVGPSGANFYSTYAVSLDISGATGRAYSALDELNSGGTLSNEFFTVDLATGAFTKVADLGYQLRDLAVAPAASTVPEPGSIALLGLGLLPFVVGRRGSMGVKRTRCRSS